MEFKPVAKVGSADHDHEDHPELNRSPPFREEQDLLCAGCHKPLGGVWFQNSLGGQWHPSCFLCAGCQKPITERQGRDPYHSPCYKRKFDPICEVCHDYIPVNEHSGMIEWRFHPFWGNKYCPAHETDLTARCGSCERMQPRDERYAILDCGRKLCTQCFDSVIMDSKESQALYQSVLDFYKQLGLTFDQEIPLLLVDRNALKAAAEKDGNHRFEPDARGMCLTEEHTVETVCTQLYRGSSISRPNAALDQTNGPTHEPQRFSRKCLVARILVLFGFPRLLTGSIVAHEMMHAWLKLNGPFPSSIPRSAVEEGTCQLMAYLWLQTQVGHLASNSSLKSQSERRLGQCFMHQIEKHDSPVYGDGFRAAQAAITKHGLLNTLHRIKTSGSF